MDKGEYINLSLNGVSVHHEKSPVREKRRHFHVNQHEVFLTIQGDAVYFQNNNEVFCSPGSMIYTPPGIEHMFYSKIRDFGERIVILIDSEVWNEYSLKKFDAIKIPAMKVLKNLCLYVLSSHNSNNLDIYLKSIISLIVDQLLQYQNLSYFFNAYKIQTIKDERIKEACRLLSKTIDMNFSDVAKESGLSLRNFHRLFTQEIGVNPKTFVVLLKIDHAKKMLLNSNKSIIEISTELGYASVSSFSTIFNKYTGMKPTEYRNTIENKEIEFLSFGKNPMK